MLNWKTIDTNFLDYLRSGKQRIPKTDYSGERMKPFFGVLFEKDDLCYVTQVSSPKSRYKNVKQTLDFFKFYENGKLL